MNLKALITTLVLGSSSMASADSLTFSGSVTVSLGGSSTTSVPAGGIVRHYEPSQPARPVVVDDCNTPASRPYQPVPARPVVVTHPVAYQPPVAQPVWQAPWFNITNSTVGATASSYNGWVANSKVLTRSSLNLYPNRIAPSTWFDLTEATRIDSGRQFFKIGADNGLFRGIKLQALGGGRSKIEQVGIEYLDAQGRAKTQKVKLDTFIDRNNPTITIDLDGNYRSINRIIVYGATDKGSAYKLMAM